MLILRGRQKYRGPLRAVGEAGDPRRQTEKLSLFSTACFPPSTSARELTTVTSIHERELTYVAQVMIRGVANRQTDLVDGLAVPGADIPLHVVDLVRLRVDLVPSLEAVVVEVLRHLLFVLVEQRVAAGKKLQPQGCGRRVKHLRVRTLVAFQGEAVHALPSQQETERRAYLRWLYFVRRSLLVKKNVL